MKDYKQTVYCCAELRLKESSSSNSRNSKVKLIEAETDHQQGRQMILKESGETRCISRPTRVTYFKRDPCPAIIMMMIVRNNRK